MTDMLPKLKRSRSTPVADLPEQPHPSAEKISPVVADLPGDTSELLVQSLAAGRTSGGALGAVLGELNALPHVAFPAPATEREEHIQELLKIEMLLQAAENARKAALSKKYLPASQFRQILLPTTKEYFPAAQSVQEVAFKIDENFPVAQFIQLVDAVT